MKRGFVVATVCAAVLCLAPQLWARTLYLKDGEAIRCQRYWLEGGRVYVLINRDTEVDFAPDEVDLAKSAKAARAEKKGLHKKHRRHGKRPHHRTHATPKPAAEGAKRQAPAEKPAAAPPAAARPVPAAGAVRTSPAGAAPGTPAARN